MPNVMLNESLAHRKMKNLTLFNLLTSNLTFKIKCHFGNRVILKAWPIVILQMMMMMMMMMTMIRKVMFARSYS